MRPATILLVLNVVVLAILGLIAAGVAKFSWHFNLGFLCGYFACYVLFRCWRADWVNEAKTTQTIKDLLR